MAGEYDGDCDEEVLANGDSVEERVEKVDVSDADTCSTDELREKFSL